MYWRIRSFPELDHLPESVRDELVRTHLRTWQVVRLIVQCILLGAVFASFAVLFMALMLRLDTLLLWAWPVVAVFFSALIYQFRLIRIRGQLLMYLEQAAKRERLPMCLGCGYNLRGMMSDRCPECGMRIHGTRSNG